jgi:hypothetical protein
MGEIDVDAEKHKIEYLQPTTAQPHGWNCPYCNWRIRLTWKRYFTEPGVRKTCPHCGKQSTMDKTRSGKLWTIRAVSQIACGLPLGIVGLLFLGPAWGLGAFVIGGLIGGVPIDRYMDERYRQLLPLDD